MNQTFQRVDEHRIHGRRRVNQYRLPNGLTLLLACDPKTPVVSVQSWFNVGSGWEDSGRTGMAHLFEHLMFKATTNHREGEFDREMERRGCQTNAATWVDWTCYHATFPATGDNLETVLHYEADRMQNLDLNTRELESERDVVCNERRYRVDDDPEGKLYEVLYALALDGHPYGWPTIGWMADIEALSLSDCEAFYRTHYAPNNVTLVIAGNVEEASTLAMVAEHYSGMPSQPIPVSPEAPSWEDRTDSRREDLSLPMANERLLLGFWTPETTHPDFAALELAVEILFGCESARLECELVVEREMVLSIHGWVAHFRLPAITEMVAVIRAGVDARAVEERIFTALERLGSEAPELAELEKARNQFEMEAVRGVITAEGLAGKLGHYAITAGDYKFMSQAMASIRAVQPEDICRVVSQYFVPGRCSIVLGRPTRESEDSS